MYLRDLVQISRGYQAPAQYLNYYTWQDKMGVGSAAAPITLAVYMRDKKQIASFGESRELEAFGASPNSSRRPDFGAHVRSTASG